MKKLNGTAVKLYAYKPGTKKIDYTIRCIIFNPKNHFIGTDEAKEIWRKHDKIPKAKMKDEYCSIFATSCKVGRGKNRHFEFSKAVKTAADAIFIIPNKWRREFYKDIENLEITIP